MEQLLLQCMWLDYVVLKADAIFCTGASALISAAEVATATTEPTNTE